MKYFNKISIFGYIFIVLSFLFFSFLLLYHPHLLNSIMAEDSHTEYLGFFFLLLTSLVLFKISFIYLKNISKNKMYFIIFLVFSILFFWAAFEEISWGQRLFQIETPDYIKNINDQHEINIHNINKKFFQRAFQHSITFLILLTTGALFFKRDKILGIKLPSILLIYSFMLIPFYTRYDRVQIEYFVGVLTLIFYSIYFIREKEIKMIFFTIASVLLMIFIVFLHIKFLKRFNLNDTPEGREYMFSFLCFIYSLELFNNLRSKKLFS